MLISAFILLLSFHSDNDFPRPKDFIQRYYVAQEEDGFYSLIYFIDRKTILSYATGKAISQVKKQEISFEKNRKEKSLDLFVLPQTGENREPVGGKLERTDGRLVIKRIPEALFCMDMNEIELREISKTEFYARIPNGYSEITRVLE